MKINGVESREVLGKSERVVVAQPDGLGHFSGHSREHGKMEGDEIWVSGVPSGVLDVIELEPSEADERGIIYSDGVRGGIGLVGSNPSFKLYLVKNIPPEQQDEVMKFPRRVNSNVIIEHETGGVEISDAQAA